MQTSNAYEFQMYIHYIYTHHTHTVHTPYTRVIKYSPRETEEKKYISARGFSFYLFPFSISFPEKKKILDDFTFIYIYIHWLNVIILQSTWMLSHTYMNINSTQSIFSYEVLKYQHYTVLTWYIWQWCRCLLFFVSANNCYIHFS